MRSWIVIVLFALLPMQAGAFSISGDVNGGEGGLTLKIVLCVPVTIDTFYTTIAIPFINDYELNNLDSNGYVIFAYQDLNTNLTPDLDEPRGWYGGELPEVFQLESDTSGIDIELMPPNAGGFMGTISYEGTSTGATIVIASRESDFINLPVGAGVLLTDNGNGDYTAFVDSFGTYYAMAYMDLNLNFFPDDDEPQGFYGGENAQGFEIDETDFPDDIDIVMHDPVPDAADPNAIMPQEFKLLDPYPNPFNSELTIPFELSKDADVTVMLYNVLGRTAEEIANNHYRAGAHEIHFNAHGKSSGFYVVSVTAGNGSQQKRVVYLK